MLSSLRGLEISVILSRIEAQGTLASWRCQHSSSRISCLLLLYDEDCDEAFPLPFISVQRVPSSSYCRIYPLEWYSVQATIQNTGSISTESPRYRFRVKAWCWLFSFSLGIALVEYQQPREERHVHIILSRILRLILVHIFSFPQSPFFFCRPLPCWCSILLLCLFHFHPITYTARDTQWGCLIACSRPNGNFIFSLSYLICLFFGIFSPQSLSCRSLIFFFLLMLYLSMNMQTDGRRRIWFSYGEPAIQCKSPKICSCRDLLSRNSKRTRATARPIQVRSTDYMFSHNSWQ